MDAMLPADAAAPIEVHADSSGWLSNMPWWFVSAGLHVVILLVATLVSIEHLMAVPEPIIEITARGLTPQSELKELVRGVDGFERKTLSKTDEQEIQAKDPPIFNPEATPDDHNESADNEDYSQMKGQSKEAESHLWGDGGGFRGRQAGKHPGVYDTLGIGGGGGGGKRFGGAYGGRFDKVAVGPTGKPRKPEEDAVTAALKWLARHQNPDGSWGAASHLNHCVGTKCADTGDSSADTGLTGLSLLAFLGAGYTHLSRDEQPDPVTPGRVLRFGEVVKKGLRFLMSQQDPEGCVGPRDTKYMYNHAIAALALSEAYGMSATQLFKGPAQQSIDFLIAAQNPGRAWRYTKQCGDNDTSVTGWAVMALKSAELSELNVPTKEVYEGVRKWLDEATMNSGYHRTGYNSKEAGKVFVPGKNESFVHHESMTAAGVLCRIFMMKDRNDPALSGTHYLVSDLPQNKTDWTDYYYWYYGSLALFQYDGPKGPFWKKWETAMKDALVPFQKTAKDGCANGSWTSEDDRWGFEGGRVYATAINALTLEVYYRYPNVFRGSK